MNALRFAIIIVGIAWLGLLGGIVWASTQANLMPSLQRLLEDPWGVVTLVDIYVGGVVVAVWIASRERTRPAAAVWIVLFLGLGHLITATYFLYRAVQATTLRDVFVRPEGTAP